MWILSRSAFTLSIYFPFSDNHPHSREMKLRVSQTVTAHFTHLPSLTSSSTQASVSVVHLHLVFVYLYLSSVNLHLCLVCLYPVVWILYLSLSWIGYCLSPVLVCWYPEIPKISTEFSSILFSSALWSEFSPPRLKRYGGPTGRPTHVPLSGWCWPGPMGEGPGTCQQAPSPGLAPGRVHGSLLYTIIKVSGELLCLTAGMGFRLQHWDSLQHPTPPSLKRT